MAKVTFIIGLAGSGKTHLLHEMLKTQPELFHIDEGFDPGGGGIHEKNFLHVVDCLRQGTDCVVIEAVLCFESKRVEIEKMLTTAVEDVVIVWKCFENDLNKANSNVRRRSNKGDPGGHVDINNRLSLIYTIPKGTKPLAIFEIS